MLKVADIQPHIVQEFGSRLEPLGFRRVGERKWVRFHNPPLRELFVVNAVKGATYSPAWAFSASFVPRHRGRGRFSRQSTDKNAAMDLVIDPIDITGVVPPQTFCFITGYHTEIPTEEIAACAEYFVPLALADFGRVQSVQDFCQFVLMRRQLVYRRFGFENYLQQQKLYGFVLLLLGKKEEGLEQIREYCRKTNADPNDPILSDHIRRALSLQTT